MQVLLACLDKEKKNICYFVLWFSEFFSLIYCASRLPHFLLLLVLPRFHDDGVKKMTV